MGFQSSPRVEQLEVAAAISPEEPLLHCLGNHAQNDKQFSELDATCQGVQARRWLPRSGFWGDVGRAIPGRPPRLQAFGKSWRDLRFLRCFQIRRNRSWFHAIQYVYWKCVIFLWMFKHVQAFFGMMKPMTIICLKWGWIRQPNIDVYLELVDTLWQIDILLCGLHG